MESNPSSASLQTTTKQDELPPVGSESAADDGKPPEVEPDADVSNDVTTASPEDILLGVPDPPTPGDSKRSTLQRGLRRMTKRFQEAPSIRQKARLEQVFTDRCLRLVQIGLQLTTLGAGILTSLPLWWTVRIFNDNCPLYLDMTLQSAPNDTLILETSDLQDTNLEHCLYCTFAPVFACIYAIIWLWFYILMNDWGRRTFVTGEPPADLVMMIPTTAMNIIMFVSEFVVVVMITDGVAVWCRHIKKHLNNGEDCSYVSTKHWGNVVDGELTYGYLQGAVAGAWLLLMALGGQTAVVSVRMYYYYRDRIQEEEEWVTDDEEDENSGDEDPSDYEILSGSVVFDKLSEHVTLSSGDSQAAATKPHYHELDEVTVHPEPSDTGGTWISDTGTGDCGDTLTDKKREKQITVPKDNG